MATSFFQHSWQHLSSKILLGFKPCCHHSHSHANHDEHEEWPLLFALAGSCLVFGVLGLTADFYFHASFTSLLCYIIAYITGGWDAAINTWERLKKRELDIHFLMLAVAAGAASIGSWREGALLLFLFSASGAMEHFAMGRTKKAIDALFRGTPKTARVLRDGTEIQVSVEALTPGMIVLVTTGEQIPADLEIIKGESACDESNLTGEAMPVKKTVGDTALSGTINLWGVIEGRILRPASESSLQKIIRLIQEAQKLKAPSQRFTDRFGTGYAILILTLCTIMFFVWWLILKYPPFLPSNGTASAFYRTMTLLVVASPCALVISVPSAILSAIASGARRGILYRGGAAIETLSQVSVVALDKTGTITSGNLTLSKLECFQGTEEQLQSVATNLARLSEHPLSRAIRRAAASWNLPIKEVEKFETLLGLGVKATIDGIPYVMGSSHLVQQLNLPSTATFNFKSQKTGNGAVVWVAGDHLLGRMLFTDDIREEAAITLQQLHHDGLRTIMLTGDHRAAAEMTGNKVGVGEIMSELSPEQKVTAIEKLKQTGHVRVAMIGDGVNDAPCLAAADVGVAMGARGSDAALEQAEIVLMNDRLENFLLARRLSQKARRIIYQNITVALGTVLLMVASATLMTIPLTLGVAAHEGSTLLVVLNSLRLLRLQLPKKFS